jgi:hypothetical protein
MKTNTAVTLYNRYINPTTRLEEFQRVVIPSAHWENRKAANALASGGLVNADQATVYIPMTHGAKYLSPTRWRALASRVGYWTLQVGDLIAFGAVADDVDAEYTVTDLRAEYNDVLQVRSVDEMNFGSVSMRHWKVSAQ